MGEIKSTLDLVLEKTRNLTLTDEEKRDLARAELDKRIRGIVSRYLDNLFTPSRIKKELMAIEGKDPDLPLKLLAKHLLAHFDLDADNSAVLSALNEVVGFDTAPLSALQKKYQEERETTRRSFVEDALSALEKRGVSGPAVVPNLDQIPGWVQYQRDLSKRYRERLQAIADS